MPSQPQEQKPVEQVDLNVLGGALEVCSCEADDRLVSRWTLPHRSQRLGATQRLLRDVRTISELQQGPGQ